MEISENFGGQIRRKFRRKKSSVRSSVRSFDPRRRRRRNPSLLARPADWCSRAPFSGIRSRTSRRRRSLVTTMGSWVGSTPPWRSQTRGWEWSQRFSKLSFVLGPTALAGLGSGTCRGFATCTASSTT